MTCICKVVLPGKVGSRELAFEFEPHIGDTISLPDDADGSSQLRVVTVFHEATEPHANNLPQAKLICEWTNILGPRG